MPENKTKKIIRAALLFGTLISLVFVPWTLLFAWLEPLPDTVQKEVSEALDHGFDGIIVYVNQGGNEPEFYAAGWKNRENKVPADPHSLFKIASIGKLYDAVAVTRLVNHNQLSLDKTLADYLPELEGRIENASRITLRMLVQHRSGIPNYTETPGFWTDPPENSDETLERVLDLPANFAPGEEYQYSNTNYLLISEIIKNVLGYSHHQYIKEEILTPLGLNNTFSSIHEVDIDRVMSGYYVGIRRDIKTVDYGSMVATAEDVGIFLRALNDGSLFNDGGQEIYASLYEYNHTGLIPGYQSIAKYHKEIDTVVIQFTNTTNFEGYNWSLSEMVYHRIVTILRHQASS